MKRVALLSACVMLSACAANSEIPESATDRSTVLVQTNTGSTDLQLTRDAAISTEVVAADADRVWQALPELYADLGITVTGIDTGARILTSIGRVRRINGKGMATYFNCPGSYGNLATSGDVYLTLRTQVLPGDGSVTTVRHQVEAVARSSTGAITQVHCSSKGTLEKLLHETVMTRVPAN